MACAWISNYTPILTKNTDCFAWLGSSAPLSEQIAMKKFPALYLVLSMVYSANSFAADKNVVFFITDDQDPHEANNLAGNTKYAKQLKRYQEKLKAAQSQFHDPWIMKWKYE